MRARIIRLSAACCFALLVGASTAALSQQQLNEAQAKALECMLTNVMQGEGSAKDLSDCGRMLKGRNEANKLRDLLVVRLYHQLGFEKTIDVLVKLGGESQALQRTGTTFSFRDFSFKGYARGLYATYPEISTADLVSVLRKHNAFPAKPAYADDAFTLKAALGETLTDDDFLNLLVTDYSKESSGYFYKLAYGALNSEAYRGNIADFVDSYLANKSDPRYSALVKRDHVLVDFLNFLAVYADQESLEKVGAFLSKRLDSLAYYQKMETIFVLYRLGRD